MPAIQSALQSVIEEVRTPAQVEQLVAEFLQYENEIAQAKTIFRALGIFDAKSPTCQLGAK